MQIPPDKQEELRVWSKLLALILTENISVDGIIPQLLASHSQSCPSLTPQLEQIQEFLAQGTTLTQVKAYFTRQRTLQQSALALALYCFGETPEDLALSVRRASQTRSPVIIALTGAIAGAYNSIAGIPPSWNLAFTERQKSQGVAQTIDKFWAMWTGVDCLEQVESDINATAVTSPRMMQKRPSVRLTSQKEYLRTKPINFEKQ